MKLVKSITAKNINTVPITFITSLLSSPKRRARCLLSCVSFRLFDLAVAVVEKYIHRIAPARIAHSDLAYNQLPFVL